MHQDADTAGRPGLMFGEAYGRVRVDVGQVPEGIVAVTVPVRRDGEVRLPQDVRRHLRVDQVDLVPAGSTLLFDPPDGLSARDLIWVLSGSRREWSSVVGRFKHNAERVTADLVRCGGVILRCSVDGDLDVGSPIRWYLSESWASQAPDLLAELRGAREPRRARAELLTLMAGVEQLAGERVLLAAVPEQAGLVVPQGSRTGTDAWSVYEAAVRAAAVWWPLHLTAQDGEEISAKEVAALALGGSKVWTDQQQVAFANLVGMSFDRAVSEADTGLRVKGPLSWHIGRVAADAAVAGPWVGLPVRGLRISGNARCTAVGVLLIENSDTFEQVCRRPEVTSRWLCVWGAGYATDGLVWLLSWLQPRPVAAWCDLDADGIAIVHKVSQRLGVRVHPVGMDVELWRKGPYRRRRNPEEDKARDAALARSLIGKLDGGLRELAAAVAGSGESLEQEGAHRAVLPQLAARLEELL
jgi:hypothetical protein